MSEAHGIGGAADMTRAQWFAALAGAGSAALLIGALAFQYIGGLAPCHLCILQRWPHLVAVVAALLFTVLPRKVFAGVGLLAVVIGAGIAVYHTGVEQAWWPGPTSCTMADPGAMSASDLMNQILETPVVLCDQIAWSLWGVSMAGWNAIFSAVIALLWLGALRARPRA